MGFLENTYPQVDRRWLYRTAGVVWAGAGMMLITRAVGWLEGRSTSTTLLLALAGISAALVIGYFKFGIIAQRNIRRIERLTPPVGLWAFQSVGSYLLIMFMMAFGITLRHSAIPKEYLAVLYISIGGGLIVASLRYFRR